MYKRLLNTLLRFRFCPSVFLYLSSVVPSIWLLEFDKLDRRLAEREGFNVSLSVTNGTEELATIQTFGVSRLFLEATLPIPIACISLMSIICFGTIVYGFLLPNIYSGRTYNLAFCREMGYRDSAVAHAHPHHWKMVTS